ncbi:hypothetical protein Tco_0197449 [Tanacetum coccineum]
MGRRTLGVKSNTMSSGWKVETQLEWPEARDIAKEPRIKGYQFRRIYVDRGSSSEVMYEHCFRNLGHDIKAKLRDSSVPLVGFSGEVNVNNKIIITKDDPEVGEDKINA